MTPEQWQRVRDVLGEALERKPEDRPAFLDRAFASDPALRQEVERLLASSDEARSSFLQSSTFRMGLTPGAKLGDYEVERLIGSGGMGEVYRAHDTRLGREVAIKVLPGFSSTDPDRLRRFEQEARAAAALNHPNILAVHQMGTYEGAPYLVSELLQGSTLREHLLRGPLPVRKVIDYGVQIGRGLAAAHEKGITHRDLKPENLFVTKDVRVKILDFGLAKLTQRPTFSDQSAPTVSAETEPGMVMGTVGYMAPEQVRGGVADHRTDIFAFGAILYEMLTGKRAFQKPTSAETMTAILNENPPSISQVMPGISPGLQRVVDRCLEKNPEQRFQSASDLAFALEALSEPAIIAGRRGAAKHTPPKLLVRLVLGVLVILAVAGAFLLLNRHGTSADRSQWTQVTNVPDAVSQPALSPDGHMITFIRGPSTFAGPGDVYVKMLPDGEAVQLTHDSLQKMSPVFSPDGSRVAYTAVDFKHWDTWVVPLLGGQPRLWLPNASGLTWINKQRILLSEIKDNDIHMALVSSDESRTEEHEVYLPPGSRGMAHRSSLSPDGKWVLLVEMDRALWLPCKLAALDGSSAVKTVGPPKIGCTDVAWSPDGKWMYFTTGVSGAFHIWRQRFPDGPTEQVTSGPTEEEGIAMAADGNSFITAVGSRQSSVWVHDGNGTRQLSLEGFSFDPKFTPDGKRLCYRILKGAMPSTDASELRILDLDSGRQESLLPGFAVAGIPHHTYDISPDGRQLVAITLDHQGKHRLWLVPFDRQLRPREIPNVDEGADPLYGPNGEIFFRGIDGKTAFVFRVREDGTGLQKVSDRPIASLVGIAPDGQWLVAKLPGPAGSALGALPFRQGSPARIIAAETLGQNDNEVYWSGDRKTMYLRVPENYEYWMGAKTYAFPLTAGSLWPRIPPGGFQSQAEMLKSPGAVLLNEFDAPGPTRNTYAFARVTVQRNLYRVPLP